MYKTEGTDTFQSFVDGVEKLRDQRLYLIALGNYDEAKWKAAVDRVWFTYRADWLKWRKVREMIRRI